MAGYFSRLAGTDIGPTTPIQLNSAKIGAAEAWLRRQSLAYDRKVLVSGRFTLKELLSPASRNVTSSSSEAPASTLRGPNTAARGEGIGVDIENVESLPSTDDFRGHEFYVDNFTDKEISHCLERPDPKQSLCGLWAAKEAIRKLGGGWTVATSLKAIEIIHDEEGRPSVSGFALSISHAGAFSVAVALRSPEGTNSVAGSHSVPTVTSPARNSSPLRYQSAIATTLSLLALVMAIVALLK